MAHSQPEPHARLGDRLAIAISFVHGLVRFAVEFHIEADAGAGNDLVTDGRFDDAGALWVEAMLLQRRLEDPVGERALHDHDPPPDAGSGAMGLEQALRDGALRELSRSAIGTSGLR